MRSIRLLNRRRLHSRSGFPSSRYPHSGMLPIIRRGMIPSVRNRAIQHPEFRRQRIPRLISKSAFQFPSVDAFVMRQIYLMPRSRVKEYSSVIWSDFDAPCGGHPSRGMLAYAVARRSRRDALRASKLPAGNLGLCLDFTRSACLSRRIICWAALTYAPGPDCQGQKKNKLPRFFAPIALRASSRRW